MRKDIRSKTKRHKQNRGHQGTLFAMNEAARLARLCARLQARFGLRRDPMDADGDAM